MSLGPRLLRAAVLLGLALPWPALLLAAKTDVLVLRNGDRITGEVKGVSRGKLDYSTDDAGRLAVEWLKVARLTSPHPFEVELDTGLKRTGLLAAGTRNGSLVVRGARTDTLSIGSVVGIAPLNAGFTERMTAFLDVGFSFAKANQATTFSLAGESDYRGTDYGSGLKFDSYAQGQESVPTTTRNSASLSAIRFLPNRWSLVALTSVEQNDELGLVSRLTAGGGAQRSLLRSNRAEIGASAGLVGTHERFSRAPAPDTTSTSFEGLLSLAADAFRFDSPKLDFSSTLTLFPSISSAGRVRGQLSLRLKYEVVSDFNVGINLTDTFDSRPPDPAATKNDYVTSLTIGWSYRR